MAGVLGLGDPVAKPALQRHCHAKPWLGAAPSGPQLRPQSPVLGAREGHPPHWEHRSWRSEVLRKWPLRSSEPSEGEGAPRAGKEAPKSGQIEGTVPTPPTAWRRCPGSLRERKRQGAGCRSLRPTLCLLHWTNGPPLPGSHQHPSAYHPTCCRPWASSSGSQQEPWVWGCRQPISAIATPSPTPRIQEGLQRSADSGWPTSPKSRTQIQPKNLLPSILSPIHPPFSLNT